MTKIKKRFSVGVTYDQVTPVNQMNIQTKYQYRFLAVVMFINSICAVISVAI